ncbi:hypothetical protein [uncultured Shimia sp.]|uniref:hypothetical protein n=1 Tax=uncultured Shimia sp. TaxID=573152 RepID=UPI002610601F|nr:hypothetical protein [uncultured Shimia sp.]
MIDPNELHRRIDDLTQLAGEKFGFKAKSLARAMKKIGRRLPPRAHKQAAILIEAEDRAGHPKLSRMLDAQAIDRAFGTLEAALKQIDPADRRKGMVLSTLGMVSFNLIVVFVIVMAVLLWRGLL